MVLPRPEAGLVVNYDYLWLRERAGGREEGAKARPCVIVSVVEPERVVTLAPITHSSPMNEDTGVYLPPAVKRHLGLDEFDSWVVAGEVNRFIWPGPDLRAVAGHLGRFHYGFLPHNIFAELRRKIVTLYRKQNLGIVPRTS
jgi:hypothetical protein